MGARIYVDSQEEKAMTKIIAEIGVNWLGDLRVALDMIRWSKESGADFVKFQMFSEEEICRLSEEIHEQLVKMVLDPKDVLTLCEKAKSFGLGFGVSIMYPEAFGILEERAVPVDFVKIRYADKKNDLIAAQAVKFCRTHGIEILVSCDGFHGRGYSYSSIYQDNIDIVNLMYCVPKYPPDLSEVDLSYEVSERFNGYSNHIPSKFAPMVAVSRGIDFVEVHVKSKYMKKPVDDAVSITFEELRDVCDFRDFVAKLKG